MRITPLGKPIHECFSGPVKFEAIEVCCYPGCTNEAHEKIGPGYGGVWLMACRSHKTRKRRKKVLVHITFEFTDQLNQIIKTYCDSLMENEIPSTFRITEIVRDF